MNVFYRREKVIGNENGNVWEQELMIFGKIRRIRKSKKKKKRYEYV